MAKPTLNDIKLFLDDLLLSEKKPSDPPEKILRRDHLASLTSGKIYLSQFSKKQREIDGLPAALVRDLPLAEELGVKDQRHDGCGKAIWHIAEAYQNLPSDLAAHEATSNAEAARAAFIPSLSELKGAYADEAARARTRAPKLAELKPVLQSIPLAGGKTLYDVAGEMLAAGADIGELLSERASQTSENAERENRQKAAALLSDVVGLVRRCREQIALELEERPELPANTEGQIFSYFDLLLAQRSRSEESPTQPTNTETPSKD